MDEAKALGLAVVLVGDDAGVVDLAELLEGSLERLFLEIIAEIADIDLNRAVSRGGMTLLKLRRFLAGARLLVLALPLLAAQAADLTNKAHEHGTEDERTNSNNDGRRQRGIVKQIDYFIDHFSFSLSSFADLYFRLGLISLTGFLPVISERLHPARMAEFAKRFRFNLTNALTGDIEKTTDFLKRTAVTV